VEEYGKKRESSVMRFELRFFSLFAFLDDAVRD